MDLNLVRCPFYLISALILSIMIVVGIYSFTIVGIQRDYGQHQSEDFIHSKNL